MRGLIWTEWRSRDFGEHSERVCKDGKQRMRPTLHPSKQAFKKKKTGTSWIYLLFLISNSATLSRAREHHSALSDHGSVRAWPGPLAGAAGPPGSDWRAPAGRTRKTRCGPFLLWTPCQDCPRRLLPSRHAGLSSPRTFADSAPASTQETRILG